MIKAKSRFIFLLLVIFLLVPCISVSAAQISPALEILAKDLILSKSAIAGTEIKFKAEDFDLTFGSKQQSITITTIPDKSAGSLMLGSKEVEAGQTIKRSSFKKLKFVPTTIGENETNFIFFGSTKSNYPVLCTLYILSSLNSAPTTKIINENYFNVKVVSGIAYYGNMRAVDPENDSLRYEIISSPKKGSIEITDVSFGGYKYTPNADYSGKDSFEYIVFDKYGNKSTKTTIKINVEKPEQNVFYTDLQDHWAQTSAVRLYNEGIMNGFVKDDAYVFMPNDNISRAEFLKMVMIAAGYTVKGNSVSTSFIDNAAIPDEYRGYVAAALQLGFIKGVETEAGYVFNPNSSITRAEAAVMINNIINLPEPAIKTVFADNESVPDWAANAFYALNETGIINGTGEGYISPYTELTRAQSARIICGIVDL